ncbi:MAG: PQQ-binding-like beta-propeller repeat protein [Candidatus Thermoplasmatota archaeon]|nr:PQQ-binding-like beta-propeller repeat protein [Candidatus Thermoplasmatota archaeon]
MKRICIAVALIFVIVNASIAFPLSFDNNDGLQDSPWPMFCHDVKHTGRSEYDTSGNPGTLKWKFETGEWVDSSPAIAEDGTIYVGAWGAPIFKGHLYAINPDGTLKWKFEADWIISSPAIGKDGTIYVGCDDGYLYAINPDGTLKWKFYCHDGHDIICRIHSSPAIGKDGTIYFSIVGPGCDKGRIYAISPDGTEKWHFDTGFWIYSSPAIGDDGTIYIGSHDYHLYAINPNGTLKWKFETGAEVRTSPAIADDGTIYIGSWDGYLYAINPNGTLKWKVLLPEDAEEAPAIAEDGTIYMGTVFGLSNGFLYAINPNGTLKWKFKTGVIHESPSIVGDGTIYVGAENYSYPLFQRGILYAINPDGTEKWRILVATSGISSSTAIGKDGTIYVGGHNTTSDGELVGGLYAIGGIKIERPKQGFLYFNDREIMPTKYGNTIIIGKISVNIYAFNEENVSKVEFYLDDGLVGVDTAAPFEIVLNEKAFWKHTLKAKAYYIDGSTPVQEMDLFIFNLGLSQI